MIKATVPGKLGGDAETKNVGQTTVTSFSVASDERVKENGEWVKKTQWVRCAIWGKRGETLAQYLTKGASVTVFGALTLREYVNKEGKNTPSLEMNVDDVALQGSKRDASERSGGGNSGGGSPGEDFGGGEFGGNDIPFTYASRGVAQ